MAIVFHRRRDRALGLVQVAILNVIDRNPDRAYGVAITDEVSRVVGRELTDAQVYMALQRLEEHGLVTVRVDIVSLPPKRSRGRPRKFYALTASGRKAIENAGAYFSTSSFMQSITHEGASQEGLIPTPVVV